MNKTTMNGPSGGLGLTHGRRQVDKIIRFIRRRLDLSRIVKIEILFRAIVREMRSIEPNSYKKRLVMFFSQKITGPISADRIGHLLLVFVEDLAPFEEKVVGRLSIMVKNAVGIWLRENRIVH